MKKLTKIGLCGLIALASLTIVAGCATKQGANTASAEYQEVKLGHDGRQLIPESTVLEAGNNYNITITPSENGQGCMSTIKLKGTADADVIIKDRPIAFVLEDPEPGEYEFVCNGMGMRQGSIIVQ